MTKWVISWLATACLLGQGLAQTNNVFDERVTSAGQMAATITNLGNIGNSFSGSYNVQGFPSCEYPCGSGVEHVFDGGLWLGGLIDGTVVVSTGAVDDATGYSTGKSGFEYTSTQQLGVRSTLFDDPNYSPDALSHQDYFSTFSDSAVRIQTGPNSSVPLVGHDQPIGIEVAFSALNWNFSFSNFFVILTYRITNVGTNTLENPYVGYWIDGVIRNVNVTPPGGTPFFNKGGNGYIDSLNLGYEFDATGDPGFTDSYVGTKFLGAEINGACPEGPDYDVFFNTWQFRNSSDPRYFFPTDDLRRYDKLSSGLNRLDAWESEIQTQIQGANNRSNLVSAGPFPAFAPGDVLEVAFAIVCARRVFDGNPASANTAAQRANLIQNAGWAQRAYDGEDVNGNCQLDPGEDLDGDGALTRFVLPEPPPSPRLRVEALENKIEVYWSRSPSETAIDPISKEVDFEGYRIYQSALGFDVADVQLREAALNLVGEYDLPENGLFLETGLSSIALPEPVTFEGDTTTYHYRYVFDNVADGWQHLVAVTAFDRGDVVNNVPSLESAPATNLRSVFTGKAPNEGFANGDPFAYPNPYYARADWEGSSSFEEDRKLMFANLPPRAEIRIYSTAGDLIDVLDHEAATYQGGDIRWYDTYSDPESSTFSGGEHGWDLLSTDNQIIARGLYLFVVIDKDTQEKRQGKFVVIK
jgi:hypothetical protein